jgi:hypothetical protein
MYLTVAAVGLTAMRRNLTAAALVASWLVGEAVWMATGNNLPLSTYFMADIAVITLVYAKTIRRVGARKYPTLWLQLKCLVLDLTAYDRWVVGLFLLGAWPLYVLSIEPYYKWWLLYLIVILQFMIAGAEAVHLLRCDVKQKPVSEEDNGLALAGAYRGYG